MSKSLVDMAEELGAAVQAGLIGKDAATRHLVEFSDGGLTYLGAADLLANWQTARATYEDIFGRARESLRQMGVDPDDLPEAGS